jgi:2'-5' RNA ligase
VTAIVAVTGHEDSVKDIIVPGAFADTLKRLRPKLCWHHDWKDPLGRVLHIVEVKPGDPRLPKVLPDGRKWPSEAGAVIATMQFNLRTTRGRDMFEHAVEWAKNGEAAFSIGYKVRDGMASKRADGVRVIYALDLYEVSLVLHGAHNMALALEVKDLADAAMPGLETKDSPTGITEVKAAEPMIGEGAMVALYLDADTAGQLAVADGNPAEELHVTLAFLGDGSVADSMVGDQGAIDRVVQEIGDHIAGIGGLSGSVGGIGIFPPAEPDDPTPVWVPVDVPRLEVLRERVVEACEAAGFPQGSEHGYTPHVTLGYDLPSLDPVERTPVAFNEVTLVVGGQRFPIPLGGRPAEAPMEGKAHDAVAAADEYVAELEGKALPKKQKCHYCSAQATKRIIHAEGMAYIPVCDKHLSKGKTDAAKATPDGTSDPSNIDAIRPIEGKSAAEAVMQAKTLYGGSAGAVTVPTLSEPEKVSGQVTRTPRKKDPKEGQETKMMSQMKGSHEERRESLRNALEKLLTPERAPRPDGIVAPSDCWVSIEATFDDTVIAAVTKGSDTETYQLTYSIDPTDSDKVTLGKPEKVELSVVAIPDGEEEPPEVEEGEAVQMRFIDPASAYIADATRRISAVPEGKSLDGIEGPLLALMDALAVKGFDVASAVMGDEPDPDAEDAAHAEEADAADSETDAEVSEAPDGDGDDPDAAAPEGDDEGDDVDPSKETITLDPETVRAQLAELQA